MKIIRNAIIGAGLVGLSACTLNTLNTEPFLNEKIEGVNFDAHLAREYQRRAAVEALVESEWTHAARFADKGRAASKGALVLPWLAADWNSLPDDQLDLIVGRARLMDALNLGGRQVNPEYCAKAQVFYDGWLEETHDNDVGPGGFGALQNENVLRERAAFEQMLPQCESCIEEVMQGFARDFVVYFEFDAFALTPQAEEILDAIVSHLACAQGRANLEVSITGHTDRSGADSYNVNLSEERAKKVQEGLTGRSIPVNLVAWRGEAEPAKPTEDGVREPLNRRVEIRIRVADDV